MKIYLDVTPYFWRTEDRGGIYHYIERFLAHLPLREETILLVRGRRVIDSEKVKQMAQNYPLHWVKFPGQLHKIFPVLWKRTAYLSLWHDLPLIWRAKPFLVVHDLRSLIYEEELLPLEKGLPLFSSFSSLPEFRKRWDYFKERRRALKKAFKQAHGFIAVSEFTARELQSHGIEASRIKQVYHGPLPKATPSSLPSFLEGRPFFLYVGKVEPLKNIEGLLHAFKLLERLYPSLLLVIAGPLTWYGRFLRERLPASRNVYFLDFVSPHLLETLYRSALALVLPSFYEGFGLPVLEAMSRGLAVAASIRGALPEIAGPAALYFNPLSIEEMAACMERLLQDEALRSHLGNLGKKKSQKFSWDRCVRETLSWIKEHT